MRRGNYGLEHNRLEILAGLELAIVLCLSVSSLTIDIVDITWIVVDYWEEKWLDIQ